MSTVPEDLIRLCCAPHPGGVAPVAAAGMTARGLAVKGGVVRYWATAFPDCARGWMVFLPGLSADHRLFNPQYAHFAGRWNLIAWDAPAHGLSRPWGRHPSLEEIAEALHAVLGEAGAERPVLIGQSLGGYIAQALIDLHPGTARALVSIDSSPMRRHYYKRWHLRILRHMEGMCSLWGTERFLRSRIARACSTTEHGRRNMLQQLDQYSRRELCSLLGGGFRALSEAVAQDRAYHIDCPLMIVCGSEDAAGFVKSYDEAWAEDVGVPVTWVEGAGHNSNVDDPAFVNAAIDQFLTRAAENRPQAPPHR